jgi:hypothetical protein
MLVAAFMAIIICDSGWPIVRFPENSLAKNEEVSKRKVKFQEKGSSKR